MDSAPSVQVIPSRRLTILSSSSPAAGSQVDLTPASQGSSSVSQSWEMLESQNSAPDSPVVSEVASTPNHNVPLPMCAISIQLIEPDSTSGTCNQHSFHASRSETWALTSSTCPQCRCEWSIFNPSSQGESVPVQFCRQRNHAASNFGDEDLVTVESPVTIPDDRILESPRSVPDDQTSSIPEDEALTLPDAEDSAPRLHGSVTSIMFTSSAPIPSSHSWFEPRTRRPAPYHFLSPSQAGLPRPSMKPHHSWSVPSAPGLLFARPSRGPSMFDEWIRVNQALPNDVAHFAAVARQTLSLSTPQRRMSSSLRTAEPPLSQSLAQQRSAAHHEQVISLWVELARQCSLGLVATLPAPPDVHLKVLFHQRQPGTLTRHWRSLQHWLRFSQVKDVSIFSSSFQQLLDFIVQSAHSSVEGRGSGRASVFSSVVASLRFLCERLQLSDFRALLNLPLIGAWAQSTRQLAKRSARQAPALTLYAVICLEKLFISAFSDSNWDQARLIGFFSLLIFGSLRFSDGQRVLVSACSFQNQVFRGQTWRSKAEALGFAFAVLPCGLMNSDWLTHFWSQLSIIRNCSELGRWLQIRVVLHLQLHLCVKSLSSFESEIWLRSFLTVALLA